MKPRLKESKRRRLPRLEVELLLAKSLNVDRLDLYRHPDLCLSPEERRRFRQLARERSLWKPMAYLLGSKEFWSLELRVGPEVLIPRPDTERLVEAALKAAASMSTQEVRILDLGTGSGNIAIALAKELECCQIVALDCSLAALKLARENALTHGVAGKIRFICGDLYRPFKEAVRQPPPFHLIVSNPPYIPREAWEDLPPDVRHYEPRLALDGGIGGLEYYRRILGQVQAYLAPEGFLILEIGYGQAPAVKGLVEANPTLSSPEILEDYAGIPRVAAIRRTANGKLLKGIRVE